VKQDSLNALSVLHKNYVANKMSSELLRVHSSEKVKHNAMQTFIKYTSGGSWIFYEKRQTNKKTPKRPKYIKNGKDNSTT